MAAIFEGVSNFELTSLGVSLLCKAAVTLFKMVQKYKSNQPGLEVLQVRVMSLVGILHTVEQMAKDDPVRKGLSDAVLQPLHDTLKEAINEARQRQDDYETISGKVKAFATAIWTADNIKSLNDRITEHLNTLNIANVTNLHKTLDSMHDNVGQMWDELSEGQREFARKLADQSRYASAHHQATMWQFDRLLKMDTEIRDTLRAMDAKVDEVTRQLNALIQAQAGAPPSAAAAAAEAKAVQSVALEIPIKEIAWENLQPVDTVGDKGKLGVGAFGVVRAYKYKYDFVAVKEAKDGITLNKDESEKMMVEAKLQSRLDHERVVRVMGVASDKSHARIGVVMRLMSHSLDVELARRTLALDVRMQFVLQTAQGLAYLHDEKVVHGDIKPANVMVSRDGGSVALTDFGFSSLRSSTSSLTSDGTRRGFGTPAFKAPELFEEDVHGQKLHGPSYAADIFAWLSPPTVSLCPVSYPTQRRTAPASPSAITYVCLPVCAPT